ncbi:MULTISPECIES: nucleotide disphospho-sugar-binding domain-containing protein [Actinomadura]|uniref:nucleotide disphospho-sugar-binding domain-containing protein n=1 Tax=Actinomadura TaxID=1988 RepID=UPI0026281D2C|nr:nucleotide disphospho-sugar-binding domain-containing protein [Actinomadura geliboluensis]
MRVLFVPFLMASHYLHQVPLAWALRAAGHEVRIATGQPQVADAVLRSGLTAVPVGGDYDLITEMSAVTRDQPVERMAPGEFRRRNREGLERYARAVAELTGDLAGFARRWRPDLVVADPMATFAPLVSEPLGVPLVRNLFGPDLTRRLGFPGGGAPVDGDVREAWPAPLVRLFDAHGVEPRADFAVRTVDSCPGALQLPGVPNRLPMQYVPYNGPGEEPAWLRRPRGRPRVCLTWGTVNASLRGEAGFEAPGILAALAALDVEVVAALSAADRARLGEPPPSVRVAEQLPLHLLLPTCDAIFHHGGGGAMLTAAALGVPQVVSAQSTDQALNAEQIAGAGVGIALPPRTAEPEEVKAAMAAVLFEDGTRARAAALRDDVRSQPSPAQVAARLERLVEDPPERPY